MDCHVFQEKRQLQEKRLTSNGHPHYLRCIRIFRLDFCGWQLEDENHSLQLIIYYLNGPESRLIDDWLTLLFNAINFFLYIHKSRCFQIFLV